MSARMANDGRRGCNAGKRLGVLTGGEGGSRRLIDQVGQVYDQSNRKNRLGMRLVAARALAMLGDMRGFNATIKAAGQNNGPAGDSARIRMLAAWTVGEMGDRKALCSLQRLLVDADGQVRIAAACAILRIASPAP